MKRVSDRRMVGALITGKAIAMLATFAMPVILTRFLTKDDYGVYAQFYNVLSFMTGFFYGIPGNLYYFYPNAAEEKKRTIVLQTWMMLLLISLITSAMLLIPFLGEILMGAELFTYRYILIVTIMLAIPAVIIDALYVVRNDSFAGIVFPPLTVLIKIIAIIIFVQLANSLNSVLLAVLVSQVLIFLIIIWYVGNEKGLNRFRFPVVNFDLLKQQLYYIIPFAMAGPLNTLLGRFDKIVSISFLSPSEYATYSVAFFGIPALVQIYDSFAQVYTVKLSKAWQNSDTSGMLSIYRDLVSKTYSYTIPFLLAFLLYAPKIIRVVFTEKYLDAVPLFRIYILSFLFVLLGSNLILKASGNTRKILNSYLASCIIGLPVTWFLIRKFGLYGALSGAIVNLILPKILLMFYEIRLLGCSLRQYLPWSNLFKISVISSAAIIPFLVLEGRWKFSIPVTVLFGLAYIMIVTAVEMRTNLFVFTYGELRERIVKILRVG